MSDFLTRLIERTQGVEQVAQPIIAPMFAVGPAIPYDNLPLNDESLTKPARMRKNRHSLAQQDNIPPSIPMQNFRRIREIQSSSHHNIDSGSFEAVEVASSDVTAKQKGEIVSSSPDNKDLNDTKSPKVSILSSHEFPSDRAVSEQEDNIGSSKSSHKDLPDINRSKVSTLSSDGSPLDGTVPELINKNTGLQHKKSYDAYSDVFQPQIDSEELKTVLQSINEPHTPELSHLRPYTSGRVISQRFTVPKSILSTQTIQVTIGRIEVRASATSQSQVQRPRPSVPSLSLDEYLRQRNEGQR